MRRWISSLLALTLTTSIASASAVEHHVSITTEQQGVYLERAVGRSTAGNVEVTHWERVCVAPCNMEVPSGGEYRIGGHGLRTSDSFAITRTGKIDAKLGSQDGVVAGGIFAGLGLALLVTGMIFFRAEDTVTMESDGSGGFRPKVEESPAKKYAAPFAIGGAISIAGGLYLILSNRTTVTLNGDVIGRGEVRFAGLRLRPEGLAF